MGKGTYSTLPLMPQITTSVSLEELNTRKAGIYPSLKASLIAQMDIINKKLKNDEDVLGEDRLTDALMKKYLHNINPKKEEARNKGLFVLVKHAEEQLMDDFNPPAEFWDHKLHPANERFETDVTWQSQDGEKTYTETVYHGMANKICKLMRRKQSTTYMIELRGTSTGKCQGYRKIMGLNLAKYKWCKNNKYPEKALADLAKERIEAWKNTCKNAGAVKSGYAKSLDKAFEADKKAFSKLI